MSSIVSWNNANTLDEICDSDLRQTLKNNEYLAALILIIYDKLKQIPPSDPKDRMNIAVLLAKNIVYEISRRAMAWDRPKLNFLKTLPITDLIKRLDVPEKEYVRAYTMRIREKTGNEIREDEVKNAFMDI